MPQIRTPLCLSRRLVTLRALPNNVKELLECTQWLLPDPAVQITEVEHEGALFSMIRDDLLHPLVGGNKLRKLDGLWEQLEPARDVVTCGGLQSAHTLAVAAVCAEKRSKRCHLLVRGERPAVPTGSHLYARMLAHRVVYVPRSEYADREAMFARYVAQLVQQQHEQGHAQQQAQQQGAATTAVPPAAAAAVVAAVPPAGAAAAAAAASVAGPAAEQGAEAGGVAVVPEGAAEPGALLGLIRLAAWLAQRSPLAGQRCHLVVDSGTGATATGLALGAALLDLPWQVSGVMLAGSSQYYREQQHSLVGAFSAQYPALTTATATAAATAGLHGTGSTAQLHHAVTQRLHWVDRTTPRKFGKVLPGELAACGAVAQRCGVLLDPIWSLAAWEVACQLAAARPSGGSGGSADVARDGSHAVVMLHTGGWLGLCGLAQRWPDQF